MRLTYPTSKHDSLWFAREAILMESAIDPSGLEHDIVGPKSYVNVDERLELDMKTGNLAVPVFDGTLFNMLLTFFDLRERVSTHR